MLKTFCLTAPYPRFWSYAGCYRCCFSWYDYEPERRAQGSLHACWGLILGVLDNDMTQLRVDSYVREIFVGLIVLAVVAVVFLSKRRNAK